MARSDLTRVVEPACEKLARDLGFELVDVELVREGAGRNKAENHGNCGRT